MRSSCASAGDGSPMRDVAIFNEATEQGRTADLGGVATASGWFVLFSTTREGRMGERFGDGAGSSDDVLLLMG